MNSRKEKDGPSREAGCLFLAQKARPMEKNAMPKMKLADGFFGH